MHRLNYALVPERPADAPIYRKGWRSIKPKPRHKPYARLAVGAVSGLSAGRRLDGNVRPQSPVVRMDVDPAPWAHNFEIPPWNIDFHDTARRHPEKSRARDVTDERIDVPPTNSRKAEKTRARDDPVNAMPFTSSRKARESCLSASVRPIITANITLNWHNQTVQPSSLPREPSIVTSSPIRKPDNSNDITGVVMFEDDYVDLPLVIAGHVPEYGDHMQVDSEGIATPPSVFAMLGYVLEFSETIEINQVATLILSGHHLVNTEMPYNTIINGSPVTENVFAPNLNFAGAHYNPIVNGPPYTGPPIMAENGFVHYNRLANGPLHAHIAQNFLPPDTGMVDPSYDPREPLFAPPPQVLPLNSGRQTVKGNFFKGQNVGALAGSNTPWLSNIIPLPHDNTVIHVPQGDSFIAHTYPARPPTPTPALELLNAPAIVRMEEQPVGQMEHPGDHTQLFNELFGDEGEEDEAEDEEASEQNPPWDDCGDDRIEGPSGDEDDEVEILI